MKLKKVFDDYPNPMYIVKPIIEDGVTKDFTYMYANKSFCIFIGRSYGELVGRNYSDNFDEPGEEFWFNLFSESALHRKHLYVDNVSTVIDTKMCTEVFHISPNLCGCIIHDFKKISSMMFKSMNIEDELRYKANYDCLTGFYNRYFLEEQYDEISKRSNVGITYLDINNLKVTNDTLGHKAGDSLIVRVSNTIKLIYNDSMVFRVGGDEFVVITVDRDREDFLKLSQQCITAFSKDCSVAVGYGFYERVDNLSDCIEECDALMYENKKRMKAINT